MNIKNVFSIKDLENLSGVKAHTIRIWEKRYNILQPMRSDTNIRYYNLESLQKLLNITLLHNHGFKISRIATFSDEAISQMVLDVLSEKSVKNHAINALKIAMMKFDQTSFSVTYINLLEEKSFNEIFYEVFIPLLEEIGLLWQTNTITPAHEHFISYLIRQKLLINTEKIQMLPRTKTDKVFILYLPLNEIHELGLMYLHYEIMLQGYQSIYLGESIPMENLNDLKRYFDSIVFVSYFTVQPQMDQIDDYLTKFTNEILNDSTSKLWLLGKMTRFIDTKKLIPNTVIFDTISECVDNL
ncbi:MerR family transcriptional regulator [Flavobacterium sp. GT3R68]|uniref:MerR family transcriptional regulator n=1 Tax=Flavobacterium sp. GT3R68 TaxID=2594437 RepID=UPI000F8716B3|nr:MerR family transcriptional regulator [Flavobacterium sp. GT3R68]RTY87243.1 MerR family transcriptional regulator [Flavobacterium sp. GSN2]TRW89393.1 MerR family transcriptional regulator [Flavobacterium sp. GT3R68]